jgi:hypothetical protein
MRFRSRLSREGISLLLATFTAMASVHTSALILLDPVYFRVSVVSESIENPRGYLEIVAHELFSDYKVESAADNRIACEVSLPLLLQALSSGKNATQAVIKLSKRSSDSIQSHDRNGSSNSLQQPCLSIVLDGADQLLNVDVLHEIPLRLLKVTEVLTLVSQPDISPPTVSFSLPSKKKLFRNLIERLAKLARTITLRGTVCSSQLNQARLTVTAVSDATSGVTVNSFFGGLQAHSLVQANSNPEEGDKIDIVEAEVRVAARKLLCVLEHVNVPHDDVSLFFSPREALVMYLQLQPACLGSLTFYLPVLVPI